MTVRKTGNHYAVYSKKGKKLTKKPLSKKGAKKRLQQIEYFKHKGMQMKLDKAIKRDRKRTKRNEMQVDSKSVFVIENIQKERAKGDLT